MQKLRMAIFFLLFELLVAPKISYPPQDATGVDGQDVLFSCTVDGNPPPSVIWTKEGEELKPAANWRFNLSSAGNNHSLILTDIQRSDAGQYRCLASNSDGNLTSAPATLTVHCKKFILTIYDHVHRHVFQGFQLREHAFLYLQTTFVLIRAMTVC